ncbi:MAG: B12-binding domain-containing radical SAM protein [Betaproteobacteria bacterium RIFCSPLOWO2_12_FULL_62_58]|nr:MAG: B12-binding domain-containing radical SAM protein [Betaproteobacteria bacterium RIFCSPLOWO2_12_FULL_62_58]
MRCALIIPAWAPEEIFSSRTAPSQVNYWQPLGTLYVAACLLQAGHNVRLFNGAFLTHEEILRQAREFKPEVAGIYATAFGWPGALKTAADLKRMDRSMFVCAGGPYPVAAQERCLANGAAHFDAVVTGEGEHTVVEILDRLAARRGLEGVLGVAFRQGERIIKNPPRPLIEDLDALPFPARALLEGAERCPPPPATYRRTPVATMITSRGCDRRCLFCFQIDRERKAGRRGVRLRSVANVLLEIESCLKQGYREIKFLDDSFAADYDRAMQICQAIRARRLDFTWFASACVNQVDKPLLQAMKDAGCWAILMGAESGVQKNLNTLRKACTLDQIRQAVRAAKEVGLQVSTPFLFGIPGETFADGLKTIEFAIELDPDLTNFHCLTPFPGTDLHDRCEKYGRRSSELADYTYQGAAFAPYTMTREEIQQLRQLAFRRFYSRPAFLLRRLLQVRSLREVRIAARGLKSLFWLWAARNLFYRGKKEEAVSRPG